MEEQVQKVSLGQRLRAKAVNANVNKELTNFITLLEEAADRGELELHFPDLRQVLPTFTAQQNWAAWFPNEGLGIEGVIRSDTGAYEYTVKW